MPDGLETPTPKPKETSNNADIFDQVIQAVRDRRTENLDVLMNQFTQELVQINQKYVRDQNKEAVIIDGQTTVIEGTEHQIDIASFLNVIQGYIDRNTLVKLTRKENLKKITYSDIFLYLNNMFSGLTPSFESDFGIDLEDTLKVLQLFKYSDKTSTTVEEMRTKLPLKEGKNESDSVYPLYDTIKQDDLQWSRIIPHVIAGRITPIIGVLDDI